MYFPNWGSNSIKKSDGITGIVTTLVGQFYLPDQMTKAPNGDIYFSDYEVVRKIDKTTKLITTVVGGGQDETEGGLATNAKIGRPRGVAFDSLGNLFVAEYDDNHAKIRKIDTQGRIYTIAGGAGVGNSGDGGDPLSAKLSGPAAIVIDGSDNLYIADPGVGGAGTGGVIRKINLTGTPRTITTVAGKANNNGTTGYDFTGLATAAQLNRPAYDGNMALGPDGNLYWGEGYMGGGQAIRSLILSGPNSGKISTVLLNAFRNIAFDKDGKLLTIVNRSIFKFDKSNNTLALVAGSPGATTIGGSLVTNLKVGCNLVPQVAISVGSTPNSQVATIPDGQTRASIPATAALPASA
jgi:hypothetical protein